MLHRRRGQPVIVFLAVALGWIAMRAAIWSNPLVHDATRIDAGAIGAEFADAAPVLPSNGVSALAPKASVPLARAAEYAKRKSRTDPPLPNWQMQPETVGPHVAVRSEGQRVVLASAAFASSADAPSEPTTEIDDAAERSPVYSGRSTRWHVDGWYAWRAGSGQPRVVAGGPRAPAYGGTQGGLVVRYDLAANARRPQLYVRTTHAPAPPSQADVAIGLGLRPVAGIPVHIQAEARATRMLGQTEVRPAVVAISELAPADAPLGFRVEAYAQAGYVGGREATAFVDGQVRVDRALLTLGMADLRLGGGAWGGAQKYTERLDVGPGLTLDLREAGVPARLSLDYRMRVAGRAQPNNGPALTFSTGF